jgi:hypothetical protein
MVAATGAASFFGVAAYVEAATGDAEGSMSTNFAPTATVSPSAA